MPSLRSSKVKPRSSFLRRVVVGAVGFGLVGLVVSQVIRSPDDIARAKEPPEASVITAPVERLVLSSKIITRGDVRLSDSTELVVDTDLGGEKSVGGGGSAGSPVITGKVPVENAEFVEGSVAVEVSGRPIMVLQGELPMYRSIRPGDIGPDVRQLKVALTRLGFKPGVANDTYDDATEAAVVAWYRARGYVAVSPTNEEEDGLDASRQQVDAAKRSLRSAEAALAEALEPPKPSALKGAEGQVTIATAQLDVAKSTRDKAIAEAAPETRDQVRRDQDLLVLQADQQLTTARLALVELQAPKKTELLEAEVQDARTTLADAQQKLDDQRATFGVRIPRGELIFVPSLPRRVQGVKAKIGEQPQGALLKLIGGAPQVELEVPWAQQRLLKLDEVATIADAEQGTELPGTIVYVAERPGTDGAGDAMYRVRIRPTAEDASNLIGLNVRATIPVDSTEKAVLAVPSPALFTTPNGSVHVQVRKKTARPRTCRSKPVSAPTAWWSCDQSTDSSMKATWLS